MSATAKVLDIEIREPQPQGLSRPVHSGRRLIQRKLSILDASDGAVYAAYRAIDESKLPRVVKRHISCGSHHARTVTTHFRDDFCLMIQDSMWGYDRLEFIGNESGWITLTLRLSGDTVETVGGKEYLWGPGACYTIHFVRGVSYLLRSISEKPVIEVNVAFKPAFLGARLGIATADLNSVLYPDGEVENPCVTRCRMTLEMERIIRELRGCVLTDSNYLLHAEAMTLELISLYLAELRDQTQLYQGVDPRVRDRQLLCQVKRYLEENYDREPNLDELCRVIGFSRRKLMRSFKSEFGKTIRDFHQQARMEIAKTLFLKATRNVSMVAEKTGYAYPGNFAKAFQKHVGLSPKAFLKTCTKS